MPKKLTYEFIKKQFEKEGYTLLSKEYKNNITFLDCICNHGHVTKIQYKNFIIGCRCSICKNTTLSNNFVKNIINNRGFKLVSVYKNAYTKLHLICPKGHEYYYTFNNFKNSKFGGCKICKSISQRGSNNHNYKGGVKKLELPLYSTYAPQLEWVEEVRRDPINTNILQVKCTEINCRKWYTPKTSHVLRRLMFLKSISKSEGRFYCSDECKNNCSIFGQQLYPKNFKPDYSRELQPELRDLVLERDEHECQRCGNTSDLQCHHFEGLNINPIESADIDNCITLCSECHKMAHEDEGCRYVDLRKDRVCI